MSSVCEIGSTLNYTPTRENTHALVALMFREENGGFVLMEQNEGMMVLKMRPSFNHEIEIIEGQLFECI